MAIKDPHSYTDLEQGRVSSVGLALLVDFEARQLRGTAELALEKPAEGGPLDLDSRGLTIDAVESGGEPVAYELGEEDKILGSRLRLDLPAGTERVSVRYATAPGASALQWLEPAQTAGGRHPYLFSQCQPIHARSIFPVQDSPQVRITLDAAFECPAPLRAVMSAGQQGRESAEREGWSVWRFHMPQPIPPYLIGIAVGNLASKPIGTKSYVYAEPEILEAAAWEFAEIDRIFDTAEGLFGPYEWDTFDVLVMPPSFPYGGMENARLTFLTPTLLAGDRSMVNVLAHELAHSWTGNLVTNASMNDFWLNEGFTVYAERRILEALEGTEYAAMHAAIGRHALQRDLDRFGEGSPHSRLRNDLAGLDPDEIFSLVPYEKGFLFLKLLERTIGREKFHAWLRGYIERFRFQSLDTQGLLDYLESTQPGLYAKVKGDQWVDGSGMPANEPAFRSERKDAVEQLAAGWKSGARPDREVAAKWSPEEWLLYLENLPGGFSAEDCQVLEAGFGLSGSNNGEICCVWLPIGCRAGHAPAIERAGSFLKRVGRLKFLRPIYHALLEREQTRGTARDLFATAKAGYHPIAISVIESLIKEYD